MQCGQASSHVTALSSHTNCDTPPDTLRHTSEKETSAALARSTKNPVEKLGQFLAKRSTPSLDDDPSKTSKKNAIFREKRGEVTQRRVCGGGAGWRERPKVRVCGGHGLGNGGSAATSSGAADDQGANWQPPQRRFLDESANCGASPQASGPAFVLGVGAKMRWEQSPTNAYTGIRVLAMLVGPS